MLRIGRLIQKDFTAERAEPACFALRAPRVIKRLSVLCALSGEIHRLDHPDVAVRVGHQL